MKIKLLPELLKEKITEIVADIDQYETCLSAEIAIGETSNSLITIKAYSKKEAQENEISLDENDVCVEVSE